MSRLETWPFLVGIMHSASVSPQEGNGSVWTSQQSYPLMGYRIGRPSPYPSYAPMRKGCPETEHPRMDSDFDLKLSTALSVVSDGLPPPDFGIAFTRSSVAGFLYALSVGSV